MAKTGRNDPCPCGSGKKYKRCCVEKDEAAATAAAESSREAERVRSRSRLDELAFMDAAAEELTEASNSIVDLVHAGKLDEAEAAAHAFLVNYPEVHDGYDRLGMVCEARGDKKQAAAYYRKVVAFAREHAENYDPRLAVNFQAMADELDPPPAS
jgi:tetratricopeptide (TPR) repeat protein